MMNLQRIYNLQMIYLGKSIVWWEVALELHCETKLLKIQIYLKSSPPFGAPRSRGIIGDRGHSCTSGTCLPILIEKLNGEEDNSWKNSKMPRASCWIRPPCPIKL